MAKEEYRAIPDRKTKQDGTMDGWFFPTPAPIIVL